MVVGSTNFIAFEILSDRGMFRIEFHLSSFVFIIGQVDLSSQKQVYVIGISKTKAGKTNLIVGS